MPVQRHCKGGGREAPAQADGLNLLTALCSLQEIARGFFVSVSLSSPYRRVVRCSVCVVQRNQLLENRGFLCVLPHCP